MSTQYAKLGAGILREPVAWMTHHDEPMLFLAREEAATYCDEDETPIALYTAPAAAGVADGVQQLPAKWRAIPAREPGAAYAGWFASQLEAALRNAAPEQRAVPEDVRRDALRGALAALVKAGDHLQPRILSTDGADCMDQFDAAIDAAKAALAAQPQGEGVGRE